ncbi:MULTISPECIES: hypothetical protein [unclassified Streptomyces]|uniref:hypothetical protein n=1 Tax=unclassified Streptomyces TaxID=2593676 RepID=UPI002252C5EE|nr:MULTISPECIES: hypothetical protein [unclassified Streptomyces]MCX4625443.1 hypothetical protein [Streptomyces sp. NBC_01443]WSW49043.1 hypothetical protein OG296_38920 [Streptomyces sp. NBC_01001]
MDKKKPKNLVDPEALSDEEMMKLINEILDSVPPEQAEARLLAIADGKPAARDVPVDLTPAQASSLLLFLHRGGG